MACVTSQRGYSTNLMAKIRVVPISPRICKHCGYIGLDFYVGVGSTCIACYKARCKVRYNTDHGRAYSHKKSREWHLKHPERRQKMARESHLRKTYGVSIEAYDAMLTAQEGRCYLCKKPQVDCVNGWLCVDHDHKTGKIRKLLCQKCNAGIGFFEEDPNVLLAAIAYLTTM